MKKRKEIEEEKNKKKKEEEKQIKFTYLLCRSIATHIASRSPSLTLTPLIEPGIGTYPGVDSRKIIIDAGHVSSKCMSA